MSFHVLIIGAGLGGLSCAIASRHEGLQVTILEQSKIMSEIGAGIQLPPNAVRIMSKYDLIGKLEKGGGVATQRYEIKEYKSGRILTVRPGHEWATRHFGFALYASHRADYQRVLVDEALRLGAELKLDQHVVSVECRDIKPRAILANGDQIVADAIVGADGLSSAVRPSILGHDLYPIPSGDMAYRATLLHEHISRLPTHAQDMFIGQVSRAWWGNDSHVVMYPLKRGSLWNMVLTQPDELPPDVDRTSADIEEMRARFEDWDPILRTLISNIEKCDKWRLRTLQELPTWVKGSVTLLGDACHPTLPYQAQGAAMAVEDGAVIGKLLGLHQKYNPEVRVSEVLSLYQQIREERTSLNVQGALENRAFVQMRDEDVVRLRRNEQLEQLHWENPDNDFPWSWGNMQYLKAQMGVDVVVNAEKAFFDTFSQDRSVSQLKKLDGATQIGVKA